jgi:hypothetical protein
LSTIRARRSPSSTRRPARCARRRDRQCCRTSAVGGRLRLLAVMAIFIANSSGSCRLRSIGTTDRNGSARSASVRARLATAIYRDLASGCRAFEDKHCPPSAPYPPVGRPLSELGGHVTISLPAQAKKVSPLDSGVPVIGCNALHSTEYSCKNLSSLVMRGYLCTDEHFCTL